ncbi:class I adenylate-forming enzyme family protein [Novosphingobium colocasiae]|uniref:Fatty-acyl-CoA synthase n=1 Tax=Novosphingobium colocasiae TaxID=1256513 RepID=A0A918UIU2_9SPHN|nr:AMP-binding protein [Novosphingobium colocasiae]GGZ13320.1 fatty-acyl-CoA synthase [Novosphingobium colocasiae]
MASPSIDNAALQTAASSTRDDTVRDMTLGGLLREAAAVSGERIALVSGVADPAQRHRWTYAELLEIAENVARALLVRFQPGDRIAICAPNCPEWVMLQHGVALAGMVLVPANPAYREAEMAAILEDCGAVALFHSGTWRGSDIAAMADAIRSARLPGLATIALADWSQFLASDSAAATLPVVSPDAPLLVQFTSGTTGRPKGAVLHHRGAINPPRYVAERIGFRRYGVWLNAMPMCHVGGSVLTSMATLSQHGAYVLMPEWDPALTLELTQAERCNAMLLVPTMILALLDHPDCARFDLSSIEVLLTGAAPVPPALFDRVAQRIGCRMMITFGQTEASGTVSTTAIGDGAQELAHTLGRALPNVEIAIRDPETGAPLPTGATGEIWFRGYQTMIGYFGREAETTSVLTPEGWLRSGDLGTLDARGYLSISGRLKDMIIRGGMNIYPREIEDALFDHPAVAQAAVIGLPDERWGEVVLAVVQPAEGHALSFEALHQFCRDRLAPHKTPALWCETRDFPLTSSGKIQKFALSDWLREGRLIPRPAR